MIRSDRLLFFPVVTYVRDKHFVTGNVAVQMYVQVYSTR